VRAAGPRAALALALVGAGAAVAADPVLLVDSKVPQYRDAAQAVRRHLPAVVEVEPTDLQVEDRLHGAPVIVAVGQQALALARTKGAGAPVVFCMVLGVTRGTLSASVTGVPLESDPAVVLRHIKAVAPAVKRLGLVYNPASSELWLPEAQRAAEAAALELVPRPIATAAQVKEAIKFAPPGVDALWLPPDPKLFNKEVFAYLLSVSAERRIPLFGFLDSFTQKGALASISAEYADHGERAGKLAAEILSRPEGKRLPVPPPVFSPGRLTVNVKTAAFLGIEVPAQVVADAKKVYR
jgi:putative ABC transport system substrate-binding protein